MSESETETERERECVCVSVCACLCVCACVCVYVYLCAILGAQLPNSLARPPDLRVVNLRELSLKLLAVVGGTVERQRSVGVGCVGETCVSEKERQGARESVCVCVCACACVSVCESPGAAA